MSPPPILALRDAAVTFGGKPLFTGLSMNCRGERACLVGRNGSGKSTRLRILAGAIELDACERFQQPGIRVAFMPQEPVFPSVLTAADYVASALPPDADSGAGRYRVDAALDEVGIKADQRLTGVSGGRAGDKPGPCPGRGARHPAARRADQSSRHRRDRMARGASRELRRRPFDGQPRSRLPEASVAPNLVAGSRPDLRARPGLCRVRGMVRRDCSRRRRRRPRARTSSIAAETEWARAGIPPVASATRGGVEQLARMRLERAQA